MKVSILISAYNRSHLIHRSLEKYRQQTYKDFELVIIDDGSKDNLAKVLGEYSDLPIQHARLESDLRSPNIGWLTAMDMAKGKFWVLTHPEIMVPRDAITVMVNTYYAVNTQRPPTRERRVGFACYPVPHGSQHVIDKVDWKADVNSLQTLDGFWTEQHQFGFNNSNRPLGGGISFGFTGQPKSNWDYIGRLRRTEQIGMDDRDVHMRETVLRRAGYCPPHIYVYHQWHGYDSGWEGLSSMGYNYKTEAQARLQEPTDVIK